MSDEQGQNDRKGEEFDTIQRHKRAFLAAYATTGNITAAAEAASIDRSTHYVWMHEDSAYPQLFRAAGDIATERLEYEARRRAEKGVQKVKTHQGRVIMVPSDLSDPNSPQIPLVEHEYSDVLLIFLLKGLRPDTYRERHELTGANGGPIQIQSEDLSSLSVDELRQARELRLKIDAAQQSSN